MRPTKGLDSAQFTATARAKRLFFELFDDIMLHSPLAVYNLAKGLLAMKPAWNSAIHAEFPGRESITERIE